MKLWPWLAAPVALALGGCDLAPPYVRPLVPLPSQFKDSPAEGRLLPANGTWWRNFNDPTLDDLEAQVDAANPTLAAAIAANDAAQARAAEAFSGLLPSLDAIGQTTANKQSANRPLRSANQPTFYGNNFLGGQASYEIDLWGRVRDIAKAANATAQASEDALAEARLELHAELARDYVDLRGLDDEARLIADTIRIYRAALDLTKSRLEAQIASPVDVDRAQTQLSSAEAAGSDLPQRRALLEDAVASLAGKAAASFRLPPASRAIPLPKIPRAVPVEVLFERPDIARDERLMAAANESVGAAKANFFPKFTLLALGGANDTGYRLFNIKNTFGTFGPSVDLPIFDAGLREAELKVAKADFTQAAEQYRATVLLAIREVQDNLSSIRWLASESRQTTTAADAARKAADLSMTLYRDGAASYLDVVTAQSAALDQERLAIALHTRELEARIGLMLALGGGWAPKVEPPPTIDFTPDPVELVDIVAKPQSDPPQSKR